MAMTDHDAVPDDELDGHTMDELVDYLDRGRTPYDSSIERSAACRLALDGMRRLSQLSAASLQRQADSDADRDEGWISGLLETIRSEVRSGRDVPVSHPDSALRLTITEAAVRGLIRRAGDTMPGVVMGRCTLEGDIGTPGSPVRVVVTCSVEFGDPVADVAARLRARIAAALATHTELVVESIDVVVDDVHPRRTDRA